MDQSSDRHVRRDPHAEHAAPNRRRRRRRRRKKTSVGRVLLTIVLALLILAALGLLAYTLWSSAPDVSASVMRNPVTAEPTALPTPEAVRPAASATPEPTATPEAAETKPTLSPEPESETVGRKKDTYTLLVVGRDRVGLNTDTIMVGRLDCAAGTLDVVNIPRDTLVNVPWAVKKINSVYGTLGTEGLLETIEDLVGFDIDNYVIVNTFAFQQLIDCIGGVYFDVPIFMYYDDPMQNLHINLAPGYQLLDGSKAEQLVRFRMNNDGSGYGRGDLERIETQQRFLKALAKQVLTLGNVTNLPQMIKIITENTDTDLTGGNIAFYAQEVLKLDPDNINFMTMPYDLVYIRGGSYVSIHLDTWLDMINASLNPFTADVTESNLNVLTFSDSGFYSTTGQTPGFYSFYDYNG